MKPEIIFTKDIDPNDVSLGMEIARKFHKEISSSINEFIKASSKYGHQLEPISLVANKLSQFWEPAQHRETALLVSIISMFPSLTSSTSLADMFSWLSEWGSTGFPCLTLSPEQSAAFAMTELSAEQLENFQLPWSTYLIKLPGKTFTTDDGTVDFCLVHKHINQYIPKNENTLSIFAFCHKHEYWMHRRSVQYLHNELFELNGEDNLKVSSQENRLMRLLGRAVIVSAYSATHGHLHKRTSSKKKKKNSNRRPKKQKPRHLLTNQYVIGTPVTIQAQSFVRSLISKGSAERTKLSWWVRGHYKSQPYGPQHSLRKTIFVEPYQKGLSSSPVLVREHRFKPDIKKA